MKLSLRAAIILAIVLGLCLPAAINGYFSLNSELMAAKTQINRDHQRVSDVLALGMQEPLWNLSPDSGRPLLESISSDERIVRISVTDNTLGVFLASNHPERLHGNLFTLSRPVIKQGSTIGVISVDFADGLAIQAITRKQQTYLLAVIVQLIFSLGFILFLINSRVLRPLEKLSVQSNLLASNQLNQAFIWHRKDELGQLGHSLEATRQSLNNMVRTLEQKNVQLEADLISRQQIESALRVSQDRFRRLVESTRIIPWDARPEEWRFTYVGPQAEQLLGFPLSVWYSEAFLSNYLHPDDRHLAYPLFADQAIIGQVYEFECRLLSATNKEVWVHLIATVANDENGTTHLQGFLFDINTRKQNELQLEQYRHHLEDVVENRSRNLATSNHELEILTNAIAQDLRVPLRTIEGFSQVLLDDYREKLDGNARNYLLRIRSGVLSMSSRIDDLLMLQDLSRIDLRREDINLSVIVHDIIDELTLLHPQRELVLEIDEQIQASADAHLIRIALYNFLENAWKFAKPEQATHIQFGNTLVNGQQVFFVTDQGIGFDPDQSKRLFTPFLRLQQQTNQTGNGIGLTVAQRIISRHNGHIWAKSTLGQGATFYFTLPTNTKN